MNAVELDTVSFSYNHTEILHTLDLTIETGRFFTIIGPNGAGKTTLLKIILGLLTPDKGTVQLNGRNVAAMSVLDRAREAAYVPQQEHVLFPFSVREVVMMGRSPYNRGLGFERVRDKEIARRSMALCDIIDMADRPYPKLSGGEQHRVTIARALAQQTPILALDEPNAHLDLHHQVSLFDLLQTLNRHKKKTIICVSHDINLAAAYSDRIALMHEGRLIQVGPPEKVLHNPDLISVFRTSIDVADIKGAPPRIHVVAGSTRIDESLLDDIPLELPEEIARKETQSVSSNKVPRWIYPATIVSEVLALIMTWLLRYGRQEMSIINAPFWSAGNILSVTAFSIIIALVVRLKRRRASKRSSRFVFSISVTALFLLLLGLLPWPLFAVLVFSVFAVLKVYETGL
ncbi:MAG: ABC transporter ATP-binding protein, partial [Chlorobi bacterium]|nr:ABC transporter ATP-binding protein [Chlorobiota bacterium]